MPYYCCTCPNEITRPHEHNNWDLWCADCHAKARGEDTYKIRQARAKRNFLKRVSADGRRVRGGF